MCVSIVYSGLTRALWKNHRHITLVGFKPTTFAILEQCLFVLVITSVGAESLGMLGGVTDWILMHWDFSPIQWLVIEEAPGHSPSRRLVHLKEKVTSQVSFKCLDMVGNCPVFSLGVSQNMHKISNLYKFWLNWSLKLQGNNERKTPLFAQICVLLDA